MLDTHIYQSKRTLVVVNVPRLHLVDHLETSASVYKDNAEQTGDLVGFGGRPGPSDRRIRANRPRRRRCRRQRRRLCEGERDALHARRAAVLLERLQRVLAHVHGVGPGRPEQGDGRVGRRGPPRRHAGADVGVRRRGLPGAAGVARGVQRGGVQGMYVGSDGGRSYYY